MTSSVGVSHEAVALTRWSFLPGVADMIMVNNALREKHPTENTMLERNYHPHATHLIPTPPPTPTLNGQRVDTATHLMCSKCGCWKPDDDFRMDTTRGPFRRGRRYYCRLCLSRHPMYATEAAEDIQEPVVRGRPKKKRRH